MNDTRDLTVGQTTAYPTSLRSRWVPRVATIIAWLTGPTFLRPFNAILRQWAPILSIGKFVLVSRHADVVDGLAHDTEFTIAKINAEATNRDNGPFVLSMDRSPQHDREKELLNSVMGKADLNRIRTIAVTHATECIERARQQGWIDIVGGLTRIVPLRVIGDYFGVPGPDDVVMQRWMRTLFHDLFINPLGKPRITRRAVDSYEQLRPYLLGRIAQRRDELTAGHVSGADDVLMRMVRRQGQPGMDWLDDDCIRRNISGLIIGALDTVSAAATKVIDQLLRRPVVWAEAQNAARAGDDATVSRLSSRPCGSTHTMHLFNGIAMRGLSWGEAHLGSGPLRPGSEWCLERSPVCSTGTRLRILRVFESTDRSAPICTSALDCMLVKADTSAACRFPSSSRPSCNSARSIERPAGTDELPTMVRSQTD